MEEQQDINLLLDFYGALLPNSQRTAVELYYGEDMSLSEIAEELRISRQAAHEKIKRGCEDLREYEEKLKLSEKFSGARRDLKLLREILNRVYLLPENAEDAARMSRLLDSLERNL